MLTPQEIQDQKFEKAMFGGYDMAQIDQFLDTVLNDYSSLYKENTALKAKMRVLVDKIEEYRAVDEELRKTLYNAQISAKDTVSRAQTEAERILRDARSTASQHIGDLQGQVEQEQQKLENAKRQNAAYAEKIRKAMEQSVRLMEQVMDLSAPAEKPAPAPAAAPAAPAAPVYTAPAAPVQEAPAAPAMPAAPAPAETPAVPVREEHSAAPAESLDLTPPEASAYRADPQSDTARIYGDSPFTPKPRFNFDDMRFGKSYEDKEDNQ